MNGFQKVQGFVSSVLEAALYADPRGDGLTFTEVREVAERHGFKTGEIRDALDRILKSARKASGKFNLSGTEIIHLAVFLEPNPYCPIEVFDFVYSTFRELGREHGQQRAQIDRDVLINLGRREGLDAHAIDVAIACCVVSEKIIAKENGVLLAKPQLFFADLPSDFLRRSSGENIRMGRFGLVRDVYPTVADVIARRSDHRPQSADPVRAFGEMLPQLGYDRFVSWWQEIAGELSRTDSTLAPTTTIVLSAALVEAALTFAATRVHDSGKSMKGNYFEKPPWVLNDLIKAAKRGQDAVLDGQIGERCEHLNRIRQRIHVGRYVHPKGKQLSFDIRPEEPKEAVETLNRTLRAILDWFESNP